MFYLQGTYEFQGWNKCLVDCWSGAVFNPLPKVLSQRMRGMLGMLCVRLWTCCLLTGLCLIDARVLGQAWSCSCRLSILLQLLTSVRGRIACRNCMLTLLPMYCWYG